MNPSEQRLVWTDLETGGLNGMQKGGIVGAAHYPIFEVAAVITDGNLNPIGEPFNMVVYQDDEEIEKSQKEALAMHEESGLLIRVREEGTPLAEVEKAMLAWLKANGVKKFTPKTKQGAYMAGNSIKLDRDFIMYQMPSLDQFLHYRMLDVSAFDIGSRLWNPYIAEEMNKKYRHEAMEDIKESLVEAIMYKAMFDGKSRSSFRAGYEQGVKAGNLDSMDTDWVTYRNA